ncbi:MAG: hypothetical protein ACQEVT_14060 [Pseudomonadota bacterium]|uniref:hypothetical protein n=2 Tax=Roseovarius TaxID=74030 RepID=UPI0035682945
MIGIACEDHRHIAALHRRRVEMRVAVIFQRHPRILKRWRLETGRGPDAGAFGKLGNVLLKTLCEIIAQPADAPHDLARDNAGAV